MIQVLYQYHYWFWGYDNFYTYGNTQPEFSPIGEVKGAKFALNVSIEKLHMLQNDRFTVSTVSVSEILKEKQQVNNSVASPYTTQPKH